MKNDLERFLKAQEKDYEQALNEIKNGRKTGHWIWYIFPQIAGLGFSSTSKYYSIKDKNDVAYGDMHPRFGYEKGENDTAELTIFLQHLKDFGYLKEGGNNFLGFEVRPLPGEDERIVIANAK